MNNLSMRSKENAFCRVRHLTAYTCITLLVLVLAGTANHAYGQTIPLYTYCFDRYSYSQCNDYGVNTEPEPGFESLLGYMLVSPR